MFHDAKGLATLRCTSARLLILVFASMIIAGCARNGGDSTSESASASVPTAGTADQETVQQPVTDPPPAETAPVLRGDRWYAPEQHQDSEHPYGFFESNESICALVSPRGAVILEPFNEDLRWKLGGSVVELGGTIVNPLLFESNSSHAASFRITESGPSALRVLMTPGDGRQPKLNFEFLIDGSKRTWRITTVHPEQQGSVSPSTTKPVVTVRPLTPGCPETLAAEAVTYAFQQARQLGGDYRELLAKLSEREKAVATKSAGGDESATTIPMEFRGTWAVDRNSCAAAAEIGSPPDPGAAIDTTSINRYENYCTVKRLRSESPDLLVADVTCSAEGETFDNTVTLVRVGEKLRIDGAGDYLRCPDRRSLVPTKRTGAGMDGANRSSATMAAKSDVIKPSIAHATQPEYPPSSRRLGEEGRVQMEAYVLPDGTPAEVRIQKSSGSQALDDAAITDVQRNWRFRPGRMNGQPTAMWHTFAVNFRLTDEQPAEPSSKRASLANDPCESYPSGPRAYAQRRIEAARSLVARGGHCASGWMDAYARARNQFYSLGAHLDAQDPTWCAVAMGIPLEVWENQLPMCR